MAFWEYRVSRLFGHGVWPAARVVKNRDAIVRRRRLRAEIDIQLHTHQLGRGDGDFVFFPGQVLQGEFTILEVLSTDQFRMSDDRTDGNCEFRYHHSIRGNHDAMQGVRRVRLGGSYIQLERMRRILRRHSPISCDERMHFLCRRRTFASILFVLLFVLPMTSSNRLAYLDWMRGLAVLIMLQGHVLEGWLRPEDRDTEWFWLSQFLGGLPAPIFLFLVGASLALVLDRMRAKGASARQLAMRVVRRGGWILLLAYAFRLEQFLMWYPGSHWDDVFRVDTLNCIAVCILLIGMASTMLKTRRLNIAVMGTATATLVIVTPWVYPLRPNVSELVLSYLNGNGNSSYFSVFPWAAFAFAGITFGYSLLEGRARYRRGGILQRHCSWRHMCVCAR